jgi:hypothetical protein
LSRKEITRRTQTTNPGDDEDKKGTSYTVGENVN